MHPNAKTSVHGPCRHQMLYLLKEAYKHLPTVNAYAAQWELNVDSANRLLAYEDFHKRLSRFLRDWT